MSSLRCTNTLFVVFVVASVLVGCKGGDRTPAVLAPAKLEIDPPIRNYSDPAVTVGAYRTFAILPASALRECAPAYGNELLERQMMFLLRNAMECRGYRYVQNADADTVLVIEGSNDYQETYIPPRTVVRPQYVPSERVKTRSRTWGTISSGSNYGNYSGTTTATTTVPGYWTTTTRVRDGYTVGHYYPAEVVTMYDVKTGRSVWYASGVGTSKNPDVRVSSQLLLAGMLDKLPLCNSAEENHPVGTGVLGIAFVPYTPDGDSVYPLFVQASKGTPAERAKLRYGDLIIGIDDAATANKTYNEVVAMLRGETGTDCILTIMRGGKTFQTKLVRAPRERSNNG